MPVNEGRIYNHDADGCVITLTKTSASVSAQAVLNVVDGTIEMIIGGDEVADIGQDSDRGVLPAKYRVAGETESFLNLDVMYVSTNSADAMVALLADAGVESDGYAARIDTIVVKEPAYKGSSTGKQWTWSNLVKAEPPRIASGGKSGRSTMSVRLKASKTPTPASY